jgi:uncharacterized protein
MEHLIRITAFIAGSFLSMWPYLVLTIPLAIIVQASGASSFINKVFSKNPAVAILLATLAGGFSPFCSCSVVPVIASLLMGGVPLAPVMSFWIASPSMDPETFLLSVSSIGWRLSVWRIGSIILISILAGLITHLAVHKGLLGKTPLVPVGSATASLGQDRTESNNNCSSCKTDTGVDSFYSSILKKTWEASFMIMKFMAIAFFFNALIVYYVPGEFITGIIGGSSSFAVIIAALAGIPAYTSNLTALPLTGSLLDLGMDPGAALAFLIAGPTTTLPALMAVWGIVNRRTFILYISLSFSGALLAGTVYNLVN